MGKFFNQKLMNAKRIPHNSRIKGNAVEEMRVAFNQTNSLGDSTPTIDLDSKRQVVLDRMSKARAARGKNQDG